ncbi:LETM1-related biofilm-associated protein [Flavobacterium sp. SUN046]|uniref:LETM1-related biofilm-associated protein n=1 Tax=Flavobacterium sp. SUN046 TaxID=3002440 RepID=UPI002DC03407|nr:LETM1-related biofilm-associated protein [Flavobacterium sp. SUN046]MEC4048634.1 LETM1-related biofilm-associated protein [Flavobacterium sp. SUN046]
MINPSANGWIDKYFVEQTNIHDLTSINNLSIYKEIRETGFIYGHIIGINSKPTIDISQWKSEEVSKIALLNVLYDIYCYSTKETTPKIFIKKTVSFYEAMNPKGFALFDKIMTGSQSTKLESIIDERVQTNKDIISKNFSHIVTNALLFVDVLAFHQYLIKGHIPEKYLKRIEEIIMSVVSLSLKVKTNNSAYDDLLIKLFEASVRYSKFSKINVQNLESLPLHHFTNDFEKYYLFDLASLAMWDNGKTENEELFFLSKLGEAMDLEDAFINDSIALTNTFIELHQKEIPYFNYSNPVKHFYDQTTQNVEMLIKRNKKRLTKEISESKELMLLLKKSTQQDLDSDEKKKVKKQLLDICKSIPSLTIFLLPGGSLLLPILVKFIPKLLPSAFNENLED